MTVESTLVEKARQVIAERQAPWQGLYREDDSHAVEALMRSGHLGRFFPDADLSDPREQEALATLSLTMGA